MTADRTLPVDREPQAGAPAGWRPVGRVGAAHCAVVVLMVDLADARPSGCWSTRSGRRRTSPRTGWWTALVAAVPASPSRTTSDVLDQSGHRRRRSSTACSSRSRPPIIPIFVAAFAAYAFSWMDFPGRNLLFVVVVGLLVVPLQTTLIPILQAVRRAGASTGAVPGRLAGPHRLRPAVRDLPAAQLHGLAAASEVFESAAIDGASP